MAPQWGRGAGLDVKARRVKDAMSSYLVRRDDGIIDIKKRVFLDDKILCIIQMK